MDFTCTDASVVAIQEPNPKRTAALFVLKTREGHLTQTTMNQVVQSASSLCEEVVHNLKGEIREALQDIGLHETDMKTVLDRLAGVSHNPFEGLMTEYKQVQYYKENFNYLVSVKLCIDCVYNTKLISMHAHI